MSCYVVKSRLSIIFRPHCSTAYVDVAYCYRLNSVVWRSVTVVSPAKTVKQIKMPYGLRTQVGPRNHVLDGVKIPHGKGQFWGRKRPPIVKYRDTAVSCAKTAELFGICTWWPKEPCVRWGVQIAQCEGAILRGKDMPGHAQRHCAVGCAKLAEPIMMPFGLWSWVGQGSMPRGNFYGKGMPNDTVLSAVQKWLNWSRCHLGYGLRWAQGSMCYIVCTLVPPSNTIKLSMFGSRAKMAKTTKVPFGVWTRVGQRNHVLAKESRSHHAKRQVLGERTTQGMPGDTLPWAVQK